MNTPVDALAMAHTTLIDAFGIAATYTAPTAGASAVPCTIMVDTTPDESALQEVAQTHRRVAVFLVKFAQINLPQYNGTFTLAAGLNAGDWKVRKIKPLTGGNWQLTCGSDEKDAVIAPNAGHHDYPLG